MNSQLSDNVYREPNKVNDDFLFYFSENNKKRKCRWRLCKCCTGFIFITGLNALSFYVGYLVSENNLITDGSNI